MAKLPTAPKIDHYSIAIDLLRDPENHEALSAEPRGKYLHWEELRHHEPPGKLTHKEWWQLVKLARSSRRAIPLRDGAKNSFTFSMPDCIQRFAHEIDRDASGRLELPEDVTSRATRDRYVVNSLIEEAFRSSQLEGASTTREVAKEMIRSQREPETKSERMILNNYFAMEWVREHKESPLTAGLVFELHRIVTNGTLDKPDGAGRLRRPDERIWVESKTGEIVHVPPDANELPARLTGLCDFANGVGSEKEFIHPVVRAILVHFWLAYDHPFVDGNGRTARALFYWSMLKQGYWLTEFISISRVIGLARGQYDRAFLYTESDQNDTTYFLLNQFEVLRKAIDDLFVYLKRKAEELRDIEQRLRIRDDLNHRQLALLSHVVANPGARITIDSHQSSHRTAYQTARTDLLELVKHGFLVQRKTGKAFYFTPAKDIHKKLKS